MKKVSIGLPVYNSEKFIKKAVDSILSQTYKDFELLISDNGSTDNTPDILKGYKDPRIKILHIDKTVPSVQNWNNCIKHAHGDYIALYHSDDLYEPDMIEKQVDRFGSNPQLGAVFTRAYVIDDKDDVIGEQFIDNDLDINKPIDFNIAFHTYIESGKGSFICPSFMSKRTVLDEVGLFNETDFRFAFDYDLYFRILEKHPVMIINEKLMSYRRHKDQGTNKVMVKGVLPDDFFNLYNKFMSSPALTIPLDKKVIKSVRKAEKNGYYSCASRALSRNDLAFTHEMLTKAVLIDPGIFDTLVKLALNNNKLGLISGIIKRMNP